MAKQWYIVHTFSGYEQKAKAALEERIKMLGQQDNFGEILVPVEKVVERLLQVGCYCSASILARHLAAPD